MKMAQRKILLISGRSWYPHSDSSTRKAQLQTSVSGLTTSDLGEYLARFTHLLSMELTGNRPTVFGHPCFTACETNECIVLRATFKLGHLGTPS